MPKHWYTYETNDHFVTHMKARHEFRGPFNKKDALDTALWHMNQSMRNEVKTNIHVVHKDRMHDIRRKNNVSGLRTVIYDNKCQHENLRGIYGDEINHSQGYRLSCAYCGKFIDGPVSKATDRK